MSNIITYQIKDHIATLTLNQPDKLNAMDESMGYAFEKALQEIEKQPDVRVLIITGAGRAFSSGGDLGMIEAKISKTQKINKEELKKFYRIFLHVRHLPFPVIAAINGHAVGAGFCLALACDLRYASDKAKMSANFARIGLAPGMGATYLITRLVGPIRAAEIMMLAEIHSAQKANELGLLNGIIKHNELMSHVNHVAHALAQNGPIPLAMIKKGIHKAMHATLEEMFDYDSTCQAECFVTEDIKEGIRAVREKRGPRFKGN